MKLIHKISFILLGLLVIFLLSTNYDLVYSEKGLETQDEVKWQLVSNYKELIGKVNFNLFIPEKLPDNLSLETIEYFEAKDRVKYTFDSLDGKLVVTQGPIDYDQQAEIKENKHGHVLIKGIEADIYIDEGDLVISFEMDGAHIELKGTNVLKDEMVQLGESLFSLTTIMSENEIRFEERLNSWHLENYKPKNKSFLVFTSGSELNKFLADNDITTEFNTTLQKDEVMIGIFAGEKSSGGFEIHATHIYAAEDRWFVIYEEVSPNKSQIVPAVMTSPFQLIVVKTIDGKKPKTITFLNSSGEIVESIIN